MCGGVQHAHAHTPEREHAGHRAAKTGSLPRHAARAAPPTSIVRAQKKIPLDTAHGKHASWIQSADNGFWLPTQFMDRVEESPATVSTAASKTSVKAPSSPAPAPAPQKKPTSARKAAAAKAATQVATAAAVSAAAASEGAATAASAARSKRLAAQTSTTPAAPTPAPAPAPAPTPAPVAAEPEKEPEPISEADAEDAILAGIMGSLPGDDDAAPGAAVSLSSFDTTVAGGDDDGMPDFSSGGGLSLGAYDSPVRLSCMVLCRQPLLSRALCH